VFGKQKRNSTAVNEKASGRDSVVKGERLSESGKNGPLSVDLEGRGGQNSHFQEDL
jgi:hypothetical protein